MELGDRELELLRMSLRINNLKRKLKTKPKTTIERHKRPWYELQLSTYEREFKEARRQPRELPDTPVFRKFKEQCAAAKEKQRIADQSARDQAAN